MSEEKWRNWVPPKFTKVREAVGKNRSVTKDVLRLLAKDAVPRVRLAVALHVRVPLSVLEELGRDQDEEVRRVAQRMNIVRTHAETAELELSQYILDGHLTEREMIRYIEWVLQLHLEREVKEALLGLLELPNTYNCELAALLQRSWMPEIILRYYAGACMWQNRWWVAMHPRTPEEVREKLRKDGNRAVRWAAQGVFGG